MSPPKPHDSAVAAAVNFGRAREWRGSAFQHERSRLPVPPLVEMTGLLADWRCTARGSR